MLNRIKVFLLRLFRGKDPLEISYSKISAYRFCPWKYKLIYVDGRKVPPNPYIALGLSIHKTLEQFHKQGGEGLDDMLDIYNQVWVNEGFQNAQQTQHFYEKGEKMLRQYLEWSRLRKSQVVAVEKEFRFRVGKRYLRGIIDRIDKLPDDTYELIDYKTHAEMWDKEKIDNDLQLTLYSLGSRQALNLQPSVLSYFFLAHNRVVSTARSAGQEKAALEEMEAVARAIEGREFSPDLGKCARCDFKQTCKFGANGSGPHGS